MNIEDQLKQWCITNTGPYRRPFAPNPRWATAQVIIVGTNPATPLGDEFASFDEYWDALTVNPEKFLKRYAAQHGGGMSKSTKWTRQLVQLLQPLNCLITNAWWYPVKKQGEIPKEEWTFGENALNGLLRSLKPRALFCHGSVAEAFARSLGVAADRYLPPEEQHSVVNGTLVLAYHHLSGQGLRKGTRFDPASELPRFAELIKRHAGIF